MTYHGPGQVVGYPIIDLRLTGMTCIATLRDLEQVMILTAAAFGITATRFRADRRLGRLAQARSDRCPDLARW